MGKTYSPEGLIFHVGPEDLWGLVHPLKCQDKDTLKRKGEKDLVVPEYS